jgi:hypothetical protein
MRTSPVSTASWRAALPDSATPIGISRGTPGDTAGYRRLRVLEPGHWFRSVTPARYLELYSEILSRLDPAEIYDRLIAFSDNPVLLCWKQRLTVTWAEPSAIVIWSLNGLRIALTTRCRRSAT